MATTVRDLLLKVSHKVDDPEFSDIFIPWLDDLVKHTAQRLYTMGSDLVHAMYALAYAEEAGSASMPERFMGLVNRPWIGARSLYPLPSRDFVRTFPDPGAPRYFHLVGTVMYLYPVPDAAVVLEGWYAQLPESIISLEQGVPFAGLFDQALQETLTAQWAMFNQDLDQQQQATMQLSAQLVQRYRAQVDRVVLIRNGRQPTRVRPPRIV